MRLGPGCVQPRKSLPQGMGQLGVLCLSGCWASRTWLIIECSLPASVPAGSACPRRARVPKGSRCVSAVMHATACQQAGIRATACQQKSRGGGNMPGCMPCPCRRLPCPAGGRSKPRKQSFSRRDAPQLQCPGAAAKPRCSRLLLKPAVTKIPLSRPSCERCSLGCGSHRGSRPAWQPRLGRPPARWCALGDAGPGGRWQCKVQSVDRNAHPWLEIVHVCMHHGMVGHHLVPGDGC